MKFKHCSSISIFFSDIECFLTALDDQTNTGKRFSSAKQFFDKYKTNWQNLNPKTDPKDIPFVLRKISKNQDTRFALHFTHRVERALESFGPLLHLLKLSNPTDLRLWIVDTKYGVALVLLFYCPSLRLTNLQKIKQNWRISAYHECRYIPEVLEMFRSLKNIKTIKDLKKSGIPALRFLQAHLKSLESYHLGDLN